MYSMEDTSTTHVTVHDIAAIFNDSKLKVDISFRFMGLVSGNRSPNQNWLSDK